MGFGFESENTKIHTAIAGSLFASGEDTPQDFGLAHVVLGFCLQDTMIT